MTTADDTDDFETFDRLFNFWRIIVVVVAIFTIGVSVGRIVERNTGGQERQGMSE